VNASSATTCATPSPRFNATLSDSESTILNPTSIDSAHKGKALLLKQSEAILSARTPDLDARNTCAVAHCGGANHPRQPDFDRTADRDRDRDFSPDFDLAGCCCSVVAGEVEGNDGSWGSGGDEGGDVVIVVVVVGPRSAGINDEVEAASDPRPVLGARASDRLDFGGMGLNCKKQSVVSSCGAGDTDRIMKRI
jgi:hypothetical protein